MKDLTEKEIAELKATAAKVIELEAEAVRLQLDTVDDDFVKAIMLIYRCKGRVIVTGLGKSGAIGRKIAATLASTGTASYFLHAGDSLHGDLGMVMRGDVAICLSKSGNSDELDTLLPVFKKLGIPLIGITANVNSALGKYSDVLLDIKVKEEACPHDLAPTTSSTAMLTVGDALAIALLKKRRFSKEDFALLHPAGSLGKRLLLKIRDLMVSDGKSIGTVGHQDNMQQAVLEMAAKRGICAVLNDDRKVVGVLTTGDLNRLVEHTEHFFKVPVKKVMNANPKTVHPDTLAYTGYKKMEEFGIIAMPVLDDDGFLKGFVHLHDLMRAGIS